jgi:hypothetical protein
MNLLKKYKKVQFENKFNSEINWLPEGITDIYLGEKFNQPLDNVPSTTKKIVIKKHNDVGYIDFMQSLEYLPIGLEELYIHFSKNYNLPFNNLPKLKKIFLISYSYNQPINNFPDSLEEITIKQFDYNNTNKLPYNLKIIKISENKIDIEDDHKIYLKNLKNLEINYPNTQFIYNNYL